MAYTVRKQKKSYFNNKISYVVLYLTQSRYKSNHVQQYFGQKFHLVIIYSHFVSKFLYTLATIEVISGFALDLTNFLIRSHNIFDQTIFFPQDNLLKLGYVLKRTKLKQLQKISSAVFIHMISYKLISYPQTLTFELVRKKSHIS